MLIRKFCYSLLKFLETLPHMLHIFIQHSKLSVDLIADFFTLQVGMEGMQTKAESCFFFTYFITEKWVLKGDLQLNGNFRQFEFNFFD